MQSGILVVGRFTLAAPAARVLRFGPKGKRCGVPRSYITESPDDDNRAGFTLLELLVVIVILGLLIGLVAPAALRQLGGARISLAHQSIERLGSVLDLYKLDVGSYPTTEEGLQALVVKPSDVTNWNGPYLKGDQIPLDPWSHSYLYRNPSNRIGREYRSLFPWSISAIRRQPGLAHLQSVSSQVNAGRGCA